ncbi:hypothetical protein DPMN_098261 [Dreissena polymorpha]|nr:hypothetical protein DPMN_098261 [Dreissena polymorpha]
MEVTDCVKESIMDCDTSRKLLGRELLSRVEVLSGIVCEPRPPIIVPDLNLCLTTYKNLAFKLLNFDWNVT